MSLGNRSFRKVLRALSKPKHYLSVINMALVCQDFPDVFARYVFGNGSYPHRVNVRTPIGVHSMRAYSHGDLCTVNEVFCREDYKAGPGLGVVVDIGSNIGLSALYFLTRNRQSRCYLYEPVPSNVERLLENLEPFADRFELRQVAVADRAGRLTFGTESTGRYGGLQVHHPQDFARRHANVRFMDVECVHINSVLADVLERESEIDLLKIDTEGAEIATVAAIDPAFRRRIKVIYMEASGYSTTLRLEPDTRMDSLLPALALRPSADGPS